MPSKLADGCLRDARTSKIDDHGETADELLPAEGVESLVRTLVSSGP